MPNLVGVDIGCGMETVRLRKRGLNLERLDEVIRERIPSGFLVLEEPHPYNEEIDLTMLRCLKAVSYTHLDVYKRQV